MRLLSCNNCNKLPLPYEMSLPACGFAPTITLKLVVERWQSGLTRTPGKREQPKAVGGSNPPLSASSNFSRLGTSSVKPVLLLSVKTQSAIFFCLSVWSEMSPFRHVFSQFSEAGSEGRAGVNFSSSPNNGRLITSV